MVDAVGGRTSPIDVAKIITGRGFGGGLDGELPGRSGPQSTLTVAAAVAAQRAAQGQSFADGPDVQRNLLGRYSETENLNLRQYNGGKWTEFTVSRPTIIKPIRQCEGLVAYVPNEKPRDLGSLLGWHQAIQAIGNGVVYLHSPGKWFVWYDRPATEYVPVLQIACEDPVLAATLLSDAGSMAPLVTRYTANATANTSELLRPANPFRRGMIITAGGPTARFSIVLGDSVAANTGVGPPATQTGFQLAGQGASLSLVGGQNWRGEVYVACDVGGASPGNLTVTEFF